jgi:hypothetical protein
MVSFLFLFFLVFDPWKIDYLLNLACCILASLRPRNVYKDMLNNMVSPIDHVVMNHQNQTRTNGIWGHVRYIIKACYKHRPLSNGLQLKHPLQTCQQSNGHRKSSLPILTGGPHNVVRSLRHRRHRFTTHVSDIDFTVTGFVLVSVTKVPWGPREIVIFTWLVASCGNGCCFMPVTNMCYHPLPFLAYL